MTSDSHPPLDSGEGLRWRSELCRVRWGFGYCDEHNNATLRFIQKCTRARSISLLIILGSLLIIGADANTAGSWRQTDEVIELPSYVILSEPDLPEPESWHYAKVDEFEVLCGGSVKDAERLLNRFQMFRQALDIVRPVDDPEYVF